jgi:hypothetical protein
VRLSAGSRPESLPSYEFALVGAPHECPEALRPAAIWLRLDDGALERKVCAARSYPELAGEVEAAIERYGLEPFRVECLRPVPGPRQEAWESGDPPFYERHGERRVAEGIYVQVLRYRDHVLPLRDALWSHCERHA